MKKIFSLLIAIVFSLSIAMPAYATTEAIASDAISIIDSTEIIQTDDGYITVELVTVEGAARAANTVQKNKVVTKYDTDNRVLWKYTLSATFSYVYGESAVCTNATYNVFDDSSIWYFSDGSATREGNVAHGYGTFERKLIGLIVLETININISLTCDVYGNIS